MNWSIEILLYKMRNGDYFIIEIPQDLSDAGYEEGCYCEDSMVFGDYDNDYELNKLNKEQKGLYKLELTPINESLSREEIIKQADENTWHCFKIVKYEKIA